MLPEPCFGRWYRSPVAKVFGGGSSDLPAQVATHDGPRPLVRPNKTRHVRRGRDQAGASSRPRRPQHRPRVRSLTPRVGENLAAARASFSPLKARDALPVPRTRPDFLSAPLSSPYRPRRRRRRLPPRPSSASAQRAASAPRPPSIPAPSRPPPRLRPRAATTTTTPPLPLPPRPSARPNSFPSSSSSRSRPRAARRTRTSSSRPSPRRTDSPTASGKSAASAPSSSCRTRTAVRSAC